MYRLLDLFSGIGGFSLGLERSGSFKTVAFCEIEPFPRKVLKKHWPEVPIYDDVRTLTADRLRADGIGVDAICGGFPCQDISVAGKGAGIDGERSGLWSEYARLIGELRPQFVIVENVAALLGRGLDRVLGDLAALGFDAEWHCIPASAVGAPHRRDRFWLVAYPDDDASPRQRQHGGAILPQQEPIRLGGDSPSVADTAGERGTAEPEYSEDRGTRRGPPDLERARQNVANAWRYSTERCGPSIRAVSECDWWFVEPDVGRVAHGVPSRVDRLKSLGNAVVPQIPELIGRAILAAERTV